LAAILELTFLLSTGLVSEYTRMCNLEQVGRSLAEAQMEWKEILEQMFVSYLATPEALKLPFCFVGISPISC